MKRMKSFAIGRRSLIAGVGTAAGAAVLLRPLLAEAEGVVPQRFCYIHFPCGTVAGLPGEGQGAKWFWLPPSGTGASYTPSPLLDLFRATKGSILPLDGFHLLEVDQPTYGDKHAQGIMAMGTGWMAVPIDNAPIEGDPPNAKYITVPKGTKTIDQLLLEKVPALTAPLVAGQPAPASPFLPLCGTAKSMSGQGFGCLKVLSYAGNNQPLYGEGRSQNAFNNVFPKNIMPGVDMATFARQQAQKRSVLDFVLSDIQRLQSAIPVSQRPKLDAQLTAIRSLEARITNTPPTGNSITPPTLIVEPTTGHNDANADEARHQALIANMLEIIRTAFASDLARVASITFADGNNPLRPLAFCPSPAFANPNDGHGVSHSMKTPDAIEAKGEVAAFYAGAVATFLANMAKTQEGSGSVLDNTLGMYFSECRDGDTHERRRVPAMLFGGKFLKLNSGQFFAASPARYTNDIWASVLSAWGVPTTVFGDPKYGKGIVPGLFG